LEQRGFEMSPKMTMKAFLAVAFQPEFRNRGAGEELRST
jgi:hypothetical protein